MNCAARLLHQLPSGTLKRWVQMSVTVIPAPRDLHAAMNCPADSAAMAGCDWSRSVVGFLIFF
jgi:hypothetical protein